MGEWHVPPGCEKTHGTPGTEWMGWNPSDAKVKKLSGGWHHCPKCLLYIAHAKWYARCDGDHIDGQKAPCPECGGAESTFCLVCGCTGSVSEFDGSRFTACNCIPNGPAHAPTCPTQHDGTEP